MPANENKPPEGASNPQAPSVPVVPTEEARIAEQRLTALQAQASAAAADAQTAKSDAAALRGENERLTTELAGLKAANERLTAENAQLRETNAAKDQLPAVPDLPKGAFQLVESVTIATVGPDGKPLRGNAKRGDVVFVASGKGALEDAEELQEQVGKTARVFPVTRETFEELRALKHVR